jgi:energy-converting hydrogenase A subunit M
MFKKKEVVSVEQQEQQSRQKTAQQWMPVADIKSNIVLKKNGQLIMMLRIQPLNLDLLSDRECNKKVEALVEGFNGQNEAMQFFCIGRPVDLNSYLEMLQDKVRQEHDFTRKMLLKGYIQHASKVAASGDITERRFYLIISKPIGKKSEEELHSRIEQLRMALLNAELESDVCREDELIDVLSLFANPIQAAIEQAEVQYQIPSLLEREI